MFIIVIIIICMYRGSPLWDARASIAGAAAAPRGVQRLRDRREARKGDGYIMCVINVSSSIIHIIMVIIIISNSSTSGIMCYRKDGLSKKVLCVIEKTDCRRKGKCS